MFIWDAVGTDPSDNMSAVRYFWKGFGLSLRDARWIEASPICGGDAITREELEDILRPKMLSFCNQSRPELRSDIPRTPVNPSATFLQSGSFDQPWIAPDLDLSNLIAMWHEGKVSKAEILDGAMTMIRRDQHSPEKVMAILSAKGETFRSVIEDIVDLLGRTSRGMD